MLKKLSIPTVSLLILLGLLSCINANLPTSGSEILVLTGGGLIDGTGSDPVNKAVIVIQDGRILAVCRAKDIEIPTRATIVDVEGLTVLPGFFNTHVHRGASRNNLRAWAWEGVTTVRDLGYDADSLFEFRSGLPDDPQFARLVATGPLITVPGGYPDVVFGGAWSLPVESLGTAREKAEELLDRGADLLKIVLESGVIFGRRIPILSPEQAELIVKLAHGRGTRVSAHVTSVEDLRAVIKSRADDIAHMVIDGIVPDSLINRIVKNGIYWVPTLELWAGGGSPLFRANAIENLRLFVNAGGKVALGTDYEGYSIEFELGMPLREMGLMREAGMTPMQIIVAATSNAAKVCNLERELGTVEKGKIADLLVVEGDPLSDLGSLRRVKLVIHDGVIIRNELTP
jgi:imidazolonepropionase-like amidohydrolase